MKTFNVSRIAVRFWNYEKLNCLTLITYFEKLITKLFGKPKWRQCAVGSSFSEVSVPRNERNNKGKNCLWRGELSEEKVASAVEWMNKSYTNVYTVRKEMREIMRERPFGFLYKSTIYFDLFQQK